MTDPAADRARVAMAILLGATGVAHIALATASTTWTAPIVGAFGVVYFGIGQVVLTGAGRRSVRAGAVACGLGLALGLVSAALARALTPVGAVLLAVDVAVVVLGWRVLRRGADARP